MVSNLILPGQRDSRHTWRSFWPWAALFARAEAAAGIFPRSRLADGQKSSPIFVVYPTVRVVSPRSPPIKLFRAGECDVNVSKPARQSGAWQRTHSKALRAGAQRPASKCRRYGRWRPQHFKALSRSQMLLAALPGFGPSRHSAKRDGGSAERQRSSALSAAGDGTTISSESSSPNGSGARRRTRLRASSMPLAPGLARA
jgi:hypothetical protein